MTLPTTTTTRSATTPAARAARVWFVGDAEALDFGPALRRLQADASHGACTLDARESLAAALTSLEHDCQRGRQPPDVLVLGQLRPGELNTEAVHALRRQAPLAVLVALCGAWCEGEARSGSPLPGIVHVGWHQFAPRWVRHLDAWRRRRPTEWALPPTWRDEERLLLMSSLKPAAPRRRALTICLGGPAPSEDAWLADLARAQGWRVSRTAAAVEPRGAAVCGIWHADELDARRVEQLAEFAARLQPAPVIAITGFPRPEQDALVRAAGAVSLLAKPLLWDDLAAEIDWWLERTCAPSRS